MITHTSGGDPIPAGCEIGIFTPTEDENTHIVTHSLGEVPKMAYCFSIPNSSWADIPGGTILLNYLFTDPETNEFDDSLALGIGHRRNVVDIMSSDHKQYSGTTTYTTYPASMNNTQVTFATGRYYSGKFKKDCTYLYVLIK